MSSLEKAIWENLSSLNLNFARLPGVAHSDRQDLKWIYTGRPFLNRIFRAEFTPEEAAERIVQVNEMVKSWAFPPTWFIDPDSTPANLIDILKANGWENFFSRTGMALEMKAPIPEAPLPQGVTIAPVTDETGLHIWPRLFFSERSQEHKDHLSAFYRGFRQIEDKASTYFIAYLEGEPVASSLLYLGAGVAGLYWIGTLPKARRRGIATALTRHTLQHAQSLGCDRAILQASAAGVPIYRSLGFKEYCKIEVLTLKPSR
jgi:ribosomal protein S18 acetylase RimI-like enzyme